jgi:hypothetical protein
VSQEDQAAQEKEEEEGVEEKAKKVEVEAKKKNVLATAVAKVSLCDKTAAEPETALSTTQISSSMLSSSSSSSAATAKKAGGLSKYMDDSLRNFDAIVKQKALAIKNNNSSSASNSSVNTSMNSSMVSSSSGHSRASITSSNDFLTNNLGNIKRESTTSAFNSSLVPTPSVTLSSANISESTNIIVKEKEPSSAKKAKKTDVIVSNNGSSSDKTILALASSGAAVPAPTPDKVKNTPRKRAAPAAEPTSITLLAMTAVKETANSVAAPTVGQTRPAAAGVVVVPPSSTRKDKVVSVLADPIAEVSQPQPGSSKKQRVHSSAAGPAQATTASAAASKVPHTPFTNSKSSSFQPFSIDDVASPVNLPTTVSKKLLLSTAKKEVVKSNDDFTGSSAITEAFQRNHQAGAGAGSSSAADGGGAIAKPPTSASKRKPSSATTTAGAAATTTTATTAAAATAGSVAKVLKFTQESAVPVDSAKAAADDGARPIAAAAAAAASTDSAATASTAAHKSKKVSFIAPTPAPASVLASLPLPLPPPPPVQVGAAGSLPATSGMPRTTKQTQAESTAATADTAPGTTAASNSNQASQGVVASTSSTSHSSTVSGGGSSSSSSSSSSKGTNILDDPSRSIELNGKRYTRLSVLGKGGSSCVYRIIGNEDGQIYAYKRVDVRDSEDLDSVFDNYANEISLLRSLSSSATHSASGTEENAVAAAVVSSSNGSRIIELLDYEVRRDQRYIAMLLEAGDVDLAKALTQKHARSSGNAGGVLVAPGGGAATAAGAVTGLDPFFGRMVWREMLEAVDHIHNHRIVHGDLKPANFVFVKGHLKLIDFGIAKSFNSDTTNIYRESQIGTVSMDQTLA